MKNILTRVKQRLGPVRLKKIKVNTVLGLLGLSLLVNGGIFTMVIIEIFVNNDDETRFWILAVACFCSSMMATNVLRWYEYLTGRDTDGRENQS